jgi:aryl-alcohol dehydrogenase-like predicted oxidoreductase
MKYRTHRGVKVSEVGIGCYALTGVYGDKDPEEFARMLRRAVELGVTFFDTAEAYGEAERLLGQVLRDRRDDIVLATKVGIRGGLKPNLSAEYLARACDESLIRLQTEMIDLYQVHFDDPETPVEETVEALEGLAAAGKIRHYGLGHLPTERIERYCKHGKPFSILMELSAVARHSRKELLPLCAAHEIGAVAFSATGRGILTGRFGEGQSFDSKDIRSVDPLFQRERFASALRTADRLGELGQRYGKTMVQVAVAWVLAQPQVLCALAGPSTVAHLEENLGGTGWSMSHEDLEELEQLFAREDACLAEEQERSIRRILRAETMTDASAAFVDLVYAIETSVELDLTSVTEVMPLFREVYAMRGRLGADSIAKLVDLRGQLQELILPADASASDSAVNSEVDSEVNSVDAVEDAAGDAPEGIF